MVNYSRDVEDELDYEMGYEWREKDTGPLLQPFSGLRMCLIDPAQRKPEDFFTKLFDVQIFSLIAECTNIYTSGRLEQLNGKQKISHFNAFIFFIRDNKTVQVKHSFTSLQFISLYFLVYVCPCPSSSFSPSLASASDVPTRASCSSSETGNLFTKSLRVSDTSALALFLSITSPMFLEE